MKTTIIPAAPGWRRVYKLDDWPETLKEAEPIIGWQVFESDDDDGDVQLGIEPVTFNPLSSNYAIIDPDGKVHLYDSDIWESWGAFREAQS